MSLTTAAMYIDSHAHIEGKQFEQDRGEVLTRAQAAGVEALLAIGNGDGPGTLDCAANYAAKHDWIWATTGIHPHEARLADKAAYDELERVAHLPKVIAWGEIGLDYWYDHSPRDVQQAVFREQMQMAKVAKKPIIIHCRPSKRGEDAWDDCLRMLREEWAATGLGGVLHCFTGELKHVRAALDLGFLISFAGNVTYPKALNIQAAAREVPAESFLIETDSPYLAPVPHRGKRNEPAFVTETARFIGELRGTSAEEVGRQSSANFYKFFGV
ncbi:MAG TPA: TatD family hydrolase [Clostridia bacterium]|nr:TatD family hydrolase [Clostridia bacterium]